MKNIGIQLEDNTNESTGDLKIEVQRDVDGKITSGLVIGQTINQNIALIMVSQQGEFKHEPRLGIGIGDLVLDNDFLKYRHKIREQLAIDGLKVKRLDLYENKPFALEAVYE